MQRQRKRSTCELVCEHPFARPRSPISGPPPHHQPHRLFQRKCFARRPDLAVRRDPELLHLVSPVPPCHHVSHGPECENARRTYAMVSALGPSRAGPISDRVVNPEALVNFHQLRSSFTGEWMHTLDQVLLHMKPERPSKRCTPSIHALCLSL